MLILGLICFLLMTYGEIFMRGKRAQEEISKNKKSNFNLIPTLFTNILTLTSHAKFYETPSNFNCYSLEFPRLSRYFQKLCFCSRRVSSDKGIPLRKAMSAIVL